LAVWQTPKSSFEIVYEWRRSPNVQSGSEFRIEGVGSTVPFGQVYACLDGHTWAQRQGGGYLRQDLRTAVMRTHRNGGGDADVIARHGQSSVAARFVSGRGFEVTTEVRSHSGLQSGAGRQNQE